MLTILTYANTLRVSVVADEACVPDPAAIVRLFRLEFRKLFRRVQRMHVAEPQMQEPASHV